MAPQTSNVQRPADRHTNGQLHFLNFSELLKRPVCAGSIRDRIGKLSDLVFEQADPFPQLVVIYIDHGWG